ncbi:MAG: class I SAM-dependent methyltransferase [Bacteroidales bacterium]|nr:class I SAM-dependent methyltransferase [Bacteroidales bacterium]
MKTIFEKEISYWNSFSGRYDNFIKYTLGNTYQVLFKDLKEDVTPADNVLEVATGTGILTFEICRQAKHIDAIDIAPEMIRIAQVKQAEKNIMNIDFRIGDISDLPFREKTFDVVLASNVLHLLSDPNRALFEINRVLKPNGKAILPTFCHGENIISRTISFLMSLSGIKIRNKWSTESFKYFVESSGFKMLRVEVIQGKIPLVYLTAEKK